VLSWLILKRNKTGDMPTNPTALKAERDALLNQIMELRGLYGSIFRIKSTGDIKHPLRGEIDYDAKAAFESVLFQIHGGSDA